MKKYKIQICWYPEKTVPCVEKVLNQLLQDGPRGKLAKMGVSIPQLIVRANSQPMDCLYFYSTKQKLGVLVARAIGQVLVAEKILVEFYVYVNGFRPRVG